MALSLRMGVIIKRPDENTEEQIEENGGRQWSDAVPSERAPVPPEARTEEWSRFSLTASRSLEYLAMTALGNEYTAFPLCQSDWVAGLHPCLQDGVSLSAKRVTAVHSRTDTSLHLGQ